MAKLIDGKVISAAVKDSVRQEIETLKKQGIEACLAVIIVGDDPASKIYVANKEKACEYTGIRSIKYALPAIFCGVVIAAVIVSLLTMGIISL